MAGEWIKMRHALLTSPKMAMFALALGVSRHEAIGIFFQVMTVADTDANPSTGELVCTPGALDAICGRDGVAEAMEEVGWVVRSACGETILFVNFDEHNSATTKSRDAHTKRTKRARKAQSERIPSLSSSSSLPLSLSLGGENEKLERFGNWWKSYPTRGGASKGVRKEAEAEWLKLTEQQEADVVRATARLVASGQMPKDAQRFLRPPGGRAGSKGEPVYTQWLGDAVEGPSFEINGKPDRAGVQEYCGEESGADRSWAKETP